VLETLDPIRKLGEGGEGTVWLTWDRALSRWLAVKVVRLEPGARAAGEELRAKLGPAARELLDPAVAPVLATELLDTPDPRFGVTNGLALYTVMPYIHGLPAHELARCYRARLLRDG
jgi:serine/threonine protein kinase